ncbi:MAG: hypothetical protein ABJN62_07585 [Halioglobus sp.]
MPIVATMAILSLLGSEQDSSMPFTNPQALRERLNKGLTGETLSQAMVIADKLETLLNDYRNEIDAAIDVYINESSKRYATADQLRPSLQPIDEKRLLVTQEVILLRQEMLILLSSNQWESVFS